MFLGGAECFLDEEEHFLDPPEYILIREENFPDDSNCFRNDWDNSQSRTESNFRLAEIKNGQFIVQACKEF
jgi:hypothetical protein